MNKIRNVQFANLGVPGDAHLAARRRDDNTPSAFYGCWVKKQLANSSSYHHAPSTGCFMLLHQTLTTCGALTETATNDYLL